MVEVDPQTIWVGVSDSAVLAGATQDGDWGLLVEMAVKVGERRIASEGL